MNKKITSLNLCTLLILSIVSFSYLIGAQTPPSFDPESVISQVSSGSNGNFENRVESSVNQIINEGNENKLLDHIKEEMNDGNYQYKTTAQVMIQKIISKKANNCAISFEMTEKSSIQKLELDQKNLIIKVNQKEFNLDLENIPEGVTGIGVTKEGVSYYLDQENTKRIDINDPNQKLEKEGDNYFINEYTGVDGDYHRIQISFSSYGRVTFKPDGYIEISGGAQIFDPETETRISLLDKDAKPVLIGFHKKGHIIKPVQGETIGNNVLIQKEKEEFGLTILQKSKQAFIIADRGLTPDFSNYPSPDFSKENSFLIDSEGKKIYLPESLDVVWGLVGENKYEIIGNPQTPTEGTLLDGSALFGSGGQISGTGTGTTGTGTTGTGTTGTGTGTGGGGNILTWLLIAGGVVLAIILLSSFFSSDDKDKDKDKKNQSEYNDSLIDQRRIPDDLGYNYNPEEEVTTGISETPKEGEDPLIQSPYTRME
jgi:hypothetical protein